MTQEDHHEGILNGLFFGLITYAILSAITAK